MVSIFRRMRWFFLLLLALLLVGGRVILVQRDTPDRAYEPVRNQGRAWRIAYYEGGSFYEYTNHLRVVTSGLIELGWIEPLAIPEFDDSDDARLIWDFLVEHSQSDYLEFVADAFWSSEWDDDLRAVNRSAALQRLAGDSDIDLVIAMGTWAGLDLATNAHSVPTVVMSTSNAIDSGIIKSAADSGLDHVHAKCDPTRYVRQIRLFHDIVKFDTVGAIYDNSPDGRTYANLDELEQIAQERKFEIILCKAPSTNVTEEEAHLGAIRCLAELAPRIDAMWLSGGHAGIKIEYLPELLEPLFTYQVATWSPVGAEAVKRGVLISIARKDLQGLGLWTANVIGEILNGAKPRDLGQVYEVPSVIVLNRETARRIGFDLPDGIVKAADQVFDTIPAGQEP